MTTAPGPAKEGKHGAITPLLLDPSEELMEVYKAKLARKLAIALERRGLDRACMKHMIARVDWSAFFVQRRPIMYAKHHGKISKRVDTVYKIRGDHKRYWSIPSVVNALVASTPAATNTQQFDSPLPIPLPYLCYPLPYPQPLPESPATIFDTLLATPSPPSPPPPSPPPPSPPPPALPQSLVTPDVEDVYDLFAYANTFEFQHIML